MALLLALAALRAAPDDHITISVPRSWLLEGERSRCPSVRPDDVIAVLGLPDMISGSSWSERWTYSRLGIWLEWESPAVFWSLAFLLGPERTDTLIATSPPALRPLMRLATATFVPRSSLLEVGWSGWGLRAVLNFDNAGRPAVPLLSAQGCQ